MENSDILCYIRQAQQNDKQALETLVEKFSPLIKKYAHLLRDEDAYNELALFLIERLLSLPLDGFAEKDGDYHILAYLSKAVKNKYVALSKEEEHYLTTNLEFLEIHHSPDGETNFSDVEFFMLLGSLTTRQRDVIILLYYYQYSSAETAEKLHMSRQAVNQCKRRALKHLRLEIVG